MPLRILSSLAVLLAPLLPLGAGDQDWKDIKSPSGAWAARVPADWEERDGEGSAPWTENKTYVRAGDHRLAVAFSIVSIPIPLGFFEASTRALLQDAGAAMENEAKTPFDGKDAWSFEFVTGEAGSRMRVRKVLVGNGSGCVLIECGLSEPALAEDRELLEEVLSTVRITAVENPAIHPELEARSLAGESLHIALPKGGKLLMEADSGLRINWGRLSLVFVVEWSRTRLSPEDLAKFDLRQGSAPDAVQPESELGSLTRIEIEGKPCCLVHFYEKVQGQRMLTSTALYRPAGDGEVIACRFGRIGEVPFEELALLETCLREATVSPRFKEAQQEVPELDARVEVWRGHATVQLPRGWGSGTPKPAPQRKKGPNVEERMLWGADRATDLGLQAETGTMEGGREAYEAYCRTGRFDPETRPEVSPSKAILAGGREAILIEIELGPADDRWEECGLLSFEDDRYFELSCRYPLWAKDAYGGVLESVASSLQWGK